MNDEAAAAVFAHESVHAKQYRKLAKDHKNQDSFTIDLDSILKNEYEAWDTQYIYYNTSFKDILDHLGDDKIYDEKFSDRFVAMEEEVYPALREDYLLAKVLGANFDVFYKYNFNQVIDKIYANEPPLVRGKVCGSDEVHYETILLIDNPSLGVRPFLTTLPLPY